MTAPLPTTRRGFKELGRTLADESCRPLIEQIGRIALEDPTALTEELVDKFVALQMEMVDSTAADYLRLGVPPLWVMKFRSAFLIAAGNRMKDASLAVTPPAGNA